MRNHFSFRKKKGFALPKRNLAGSKESASFFRFRFSSASRPRISVPALYRAAIWGIRIALSPPTAPPRFAPALDFPEIIV